MASRLPRRLRIGSLILLALALALTLSSSALSDSPLQGPPPPTEVNVRGEDDGARIQLSEGQILVISLESNPSTGYTWEVDHAGARVEGRRILQQVGESEFRPQPAAVETARSRELPHLLGAPGTQILRFEAVEAGQTTLRLIYRRPWEQDVGPARTYSLHVDAVGSFTSAGNTTVTGPGEPPAETVVLPQDHLPLGLPSAFNWCDLGACTPVKNQGTCGSCWAFGTVAPLESNILYYERVARDLSEQYLVSCNTDEWDCGGGWFAHDYHQWKYPSSGEPESGAVYENSFPYEARDVPCGPPHSHHEKINDWDYVQSAGAVASTPAIKQAILDHGPVAAAVCAHPSFASHPRGYVFETHETQWCTENYGQSVNHAIVLVGWDDSQGTNGVWFLRNSWGPGWCESGYMRIGYGVSDVGYAANYINYEPYCRALTTNVSPSGTGTIIADPLPDCGSNEYSPETEVEITASNNPGWHFTSWSGDASGSNYTATVTLESDKSVTAHFMCDGCAPRASLPLVIKE